MNNSYPACQRADSGDAAKSLRAVPTKHVAFTAVDYTIIRMDRKRVAAERYAVELRRGNGSVASARPLASAVSSNGLELRRGH